MEREPEEVEGGGGRRRHVAVGGFISRAPRVWPTIDGPLGLTEEDSEAYARSFFKYGFFLLPWLWAINCYYFWPVFRSSRRSFPRISRYVIGSAIGFAVFTVLLFSWALTFAIGGERLFGPVWGQLVMYNVADRLGLTGKSEVQIALQQLTSMVDGLM